MWENKSSYLAILEDTTNKINNLKYLKSINKYKNDLLANITHDLKAPLNNMLIYI